MSSDPRPTLESLWTSGLVFLVTLLIFVVYYSIQFIKHNQKRGK